jgi:hypothetical protein
MGHKAYRSSPTCVKMDGMADVENGDMGKKGGNRRNSINRRSSCTRRRECRLSEDIVAANYRSGDQFTISETATRG